MRILIALDKAIGVADVAEISKRKAKATQFKKSTDVYFFENQIYFPRQKLNLFLFQ